MAKQSTIYICSNCDTQYPKWVGRCNECGKFGTVATSPTIVNHSHLSSVANLSQPAKITALGNLVNSVVERLPSGLVEVDRVLGGGLPAGAVLLMTGEPGVGKSTLLLTLAERCGQNVLYASGEESAEQVAGRLQRLNLSGAKLSFTTETNIAALSASVSELNARLVIIDSLQTMSVVGAEGRIGSPNQTRAVLSELINLAKVTKTTVVVIGHVTKAGDAAGPKAVEHLVDVVLSLDGAEHQPLRFLRATKNRFGATDEVGVFQHTTDGLVEVSNPSAIFLQERHHGAGSCITALMQGSRSLLIELQALVTPSRLAYPKHATTGFDLNRLQVLLAVLSERAGLKLKYSDIYINLAGGLKSREPAIDLAVCAAVVSANYKKIIPSDVLVFGEVGLGGEVRPVVAAERRLQEAMRLGFKYAITAPLPEGKLSSGIEIIGIKNIAEAVEWVRH